MSATERSIVGPKGRVVIPLSLREELGISEGTELIFRRSAGGGVIATTPDAIIDALAGAWGEAPSSLVEELFADRKDDLERTR